MKQATKLAVHMAAIVHPVYVAQGWTWYFPDGVRVPSLFDIAEQIDRLVETLKNDHEVFYSGTGRLVVQRIKEEYGLSDRFEVYLDLGEFE
jgi:hypothetical protein